MKGPFGLPSWPIAPEKKPSGKNTIRITVGVRVQALARHGKTGHSQITAEMLQEDPGAQRDVAGAWRAGRGPAGCWLLRLGSSAIGKLQEVLPHV